MPIYKLTVFGKQSHASMPRLGVNAIAYGCKVIKNLKSVELLNAEGGIADNVIPPSCDFTLSSKMSLDELQEVVSKEIEKIKEEESQLVKENLKYKLELLN